MPEALSSLTTYAPVNDEDQQCGAAKHQPESEPDLLPGMEVPVFMLTIEKVAASDSDTGGLQLDIADGVTAYVCGVLPGVFSTYNEGALQELQVRKGDYLVAANNARGDAQAILDEVMAAATLELEVRRPVRWLVEIHKEEGETMGLEVNYATMGTSLVVKSMGKGAVARWNEHNPDNEVRRDDRIVMVSGKEGSPSELLSMLGRSRHVVLTFSRPSVARRC